MSTTVDIVPATRAHAEALAARMRQADRAEVLASGGMSPLDALLVSMAHTPDAWCALFAGEPAAIYGAAPTAESDLGVVWALTSEAVDRHPHAFARASRAEVKRLNRQFSRLTNAIDARYATALRWARWLGFEVDEPAPFGAAGLPFCRIWRFADV